MIDELTPFSDTTPDCEGPFVVINAEVLLDQPHQFCVICDSDPVKDALHELFEVAQRSPKLVERFIDSSLGIDDLICIDSDFLSAPTSEVRIALKPSDRLLDLIAAIRAGDSDGM